MDTPCVEWAGSRQRRGYGMLWFQGRRWLAHRRAWVQARGPIPEGLNVLHRCDNPPCVNVDHLFLGTHQDNMTDKRVKGRAPGKPGETNPAAKLTQQQADEIRADPRSQRKIAKDYGVSQCTVSDIKSGRRW